jgi:hypothetical protein
MGAKSLTVGDRNPSALFSRCFAALQSCARISSPEMISRSPRQNLPLFSVMFNVNLPFEDALRNRTNAGERRAAGSDLAIIPSYFVDVINTSMCYSPKLLVAIPRITRLSEPHSLT